MKSFLRIYSATKTASVYCFCCGCCCVVVLVLVHVPFLVHVLVLDLVAVIVVAVVVIVLLLLLLFLLLLPLLSDVRHSESFLKGFYIKLTQSQANDLKLVLKMTNSNSQLLMQDLKSCFIMQSQLSQRTFFFTKLYIISNDIMKKPNSSIKIFKYS